MHIVLHVISTIHHYHPKTCLLYINSPLIFLSPFLNLITTNGLENSTSNNAAEHHDQQKKHITSSSHLHQLYTHNKLSKSIYYTDAVNYCNED